MPAVHVKTNKSRVERVQQASPVGLSFRSGAGAAAPSLAGVAQRLAAARRQAADEESYRRLDEMLAVANLVVMNRAGGMYGAGAPAAGAGAPVAPVPDRRELLWLHFLGHVATVVGAGDSPTEADLAYILANWATLVQAAIEADEGHVIAMSLNALSKHADGRLNIPGVFARTVKLLRDPETYRLGITWFRALIQVILAVPAEHGSVMKVWNGASGPFCYMAKDQAVAAVICGADPSLFYTIAGHALNGGHLKVIGPAETRPDDWTVVHAFTDGRQLIGSNEVSEAPQTSALDALLPGLADEGGAGAGASSSSSSSSSSSGEARWAFADDEEGGGEGAGGSM